MKSLKSLFTLGIMMAVSSVTFAETTTPSMMWKDNAFHTLEVGKQAVTSTQNSAKSVMSEKVKEAKESTVKAKGQVTTSKEKMKKTAKVNINTADAKTLQMLNGIGEAKAQAILDYRTQNGKIKDLKELANISGIGEATLEKLKGAISF